MNVSHRFPLWFAVAVVLCCGSAMAEPMDEDAARFFETSVRPLLVNRCLSCHGPEEQSNNLRVDSGESLLKGGDSGPAIVPGDLRKSLLWQAVERQGELQMPPEEALTDQELAALSRWIKLGAPWPDSGALITPHSGARAKTHWAFQLLKNPAVPDVPASATLHNPVDAFIAAKRVPAGLPQSPEADRRTLIRRLLFTLVGLPPSAADVA